MPNSKARFIILKIVIAVMFAAVIWKLFDLQVLKGEQYYEIANDRMTTNIVEKHREVKFLTDTEQLLYPTKSVILLLCRKPMLKTKNLTIL